MNCYRGHRSIRVAGTKVDHDGGRGGCWQERHIMLAARFLGDMYSEGFRELLQRPTQRGTDRHLDRTCPVLCTKCAPTLEFRRGDLSFRCDGIQTQGLGEVNRSSGWRPHAGNNVLIRDKRAPCLPATWGYSKEPVKEEGPPQTHLPVPCHTSRRQDCEQ